MGQCRQTSLSFHVICLLGGFSKEGTIILFTQPLQASPAEHVSPSCDGRTHKSAHLLCFMGLLCVSISFTGDMVSVWLVIRKHLGDACVSESSQCTWLPSLICQLSTGPLPSWVPSYSQPPSSCPSHTSSPFFPSPVCPLAHTCPSSSLHPPP